MKKHFMCTHTFNNEDAEQAFNQAAVNLTGAKMISIMKNEKAEVIGHWRGDEEFFYCHWYAESGDAIIDTLDDIGFGELMMTLPTEMKKRIDIHSHLTKNYGEQLKCIVTYI